jgi:hypothetical protein
MSEQPLQLPDKPNPKDFEYGGAYLRALCAWERACAIAGIPTTPLPDEDISGPRLDPEKGMA